MRILLIHPQHEIQRFGTGVYKKHLRYAPTTMPTLAALVPPELNAEVRVIDEMVEPVDLNLEADLVGLTAITSAAPHAYELAHAFKARGATTVMGGVHASLMPDEALEHVDAVVKGYAETSWPRLLQDFAAGRLGRVYEPDGSEPGTLVTPAREHIRRKEYVLSNTVEMSRGCSKRCDFCVTHRLHEAYVTKDIDQVIAEIAGLPGRLVAFLDPNLIGNIPYAREFFTALKPLKKLWAGCVSVDVLSHPGLLELMVESGGRGFLIGFESLSQAALDAAGKDFSQVKDYADAMRTFHRHGVVVQGSFVFGFDTDDKDVFERTVDFIIDAKIDLPQFTVYTPFPGTVVYERMQAEGRILSRDWSRYNGHDVVFEPKQMSVEDLDRGLRYAWSRTYSIPNILRRLWGEPYWVKPLALLSNLNFRRFMRRVHFRN